MTTILLILAVFILLWKIYNLEKEIKLIALGKYRVKEFNGERWVKKSKKRKK